MENTTYQHCKTARDTIIDNTMKSATGISVNQKYIKYSKGLQLILKYISFFNANHTYSFSKYIYAYIIINTNDNEN